jgi:putative ABC transport system permease protein
VTLQFVLSTVLVLISLVMADQLRFMKHRDPGFEKDMLVVVQREGQEEDRFFPAFRNGLANHPGVLSMSAISPAFTHGSYRSNFEYEGRNIDYHITFIDTGFLHTMGIDMIAGRNFRSGSSPDSTMHILVNQAFIDALGWEDPIGREVKGLENAGYDEPVVIGVTDNFHYQSLEYAVSPMWMALTGDSDMNDLVVRIHPSNVNAVIRDMENIWKNLSSDYPFTYSFLDEDMAALYASEERWGRIIRLSGIFAVVIAFMGMYGLIESGRQDQGNGIEEGAGSIPQPDRRYPHCSFCPAGIAGHGYRLARGMVSCRSMVVQFCLSRALPAPQRAAGFCLDLVAVLIVGWQSHLEIVDDQSG